MRNPARDPLIDEFQLQLALAKREARIKSSRLSRARQELGKAKCMGKEYAERLKVVQAFIRAAELCRTELDHATGQNRITLEVWLEDCQRKALRYCQSLPLRDVLVEDINRLVRLEEAINAGRGPAEVA